MRDGEGREIDFRNTVILMTSNLGSDHSDAAAGRTAGSHRSDLHELLRPILRDHFQPALLARFQTVIYRPLKASHAHHRGNEAVAGQQALASTLRPDHAHRESLYDALTAACLLPDTGARNVDSLLNQQILPVLSQQLLTHGRQTETTVVTP
jgi:type VI secretion system protein VasG